MFDHGDWDDSWDTTQITCRRLTFTREGPVRFLGGGCRPKIDGVFRDSTKEDGTRLYPTRRLSRNEWDETSRRWDRFFVPDFGVGSYVEGFIGPEVMDG